MEGVPSGVGLLGGEPCCLVRMAPELPPTPRHVQHYQLEVGWLNLAWGDPHLSALLFALTSPCIVQWLKSVGLSVACGR